MHVCFFPASLHSFPPTAVCAPQIPYTYSHVMTLICKCHLLLVCGFTGSLIGRVREGGGGGMGREAFLVTVDSPGR